MAMSIAIKLSAVWFPPPANGQRLWRLQTTAARPSPALGSACVPALQPPRPEETRHMLWRLNLGIAAFTAAPSLASPASPSPLAPSLSATQARDHPGWCQEADAQSCLLGLAGSWAVVSGIFQGWGSLLGPNTAGA